MDDLALSSILPPYLFTSNWLWSCHIQWWLNEGFWFWFWILVGCLIETCFLDLKFNIWDFGDLSKPSCHSLLVSLISLDYCCNSLILRYSAVPSRFCSFHA